MFQGVNIALAEKEMTQSPNDLTVGKTVIREERATQVVLTLQVVLGYKVSGMSGTHSANGAYRPEQPPLQTVRSGPQLAGPGHWAQSDCWSGRPG